MDILLPRAVAHFPLTSFDCTMMPWFPRIPSLVASMSCMSTPRQQSSIKTVRYPADNESVAVAPMSWSRRNIQISATVSMLWLECMLLLAHANTDRRKHHRQDHRHKCRWCLSASTVYTVMYPTVFCCPKTPSMNQPRDLFLYTLWCHHPQSDCKHATRSFEIELVEQKAN